MMYDGSFYGDGYAAGSLMGGVHMAETEGGGGVVIPAGKDPGVVVVAAARRPAMLTYHAPLVEMARQVLRMPLWVIGWGREQEMLKVKLMEGVTFNAKKGVRAGVPSALKLEVQHRGWEGGIVEVYDAQVVFVARFYGLRYLLYHHRILSFLTLTPLFFFTSLAATLTTFFLLTLFTSPATPAPEESPKDRDQRRHPTQRTPSHRVHPRLHYPTPPPDSFALATSSRATTGVDASTAAPLTATASASATTPPSTSPSETEDNDEDGGDIADTEGSDYHPPTSSTQQQQRQQLPTGSLQLDIPRDGNNDYGHWHGVWQQQQHNHGNNRSEADEEDDFVLGETVPLTPRGLGTEDVVRMRRM
jgi:hypothetical protein